MSTYGSFATALPRAPAITPPLAFTWLQSLARRRCASGEGLAAVGGLREQARRRSPASPPARGARVLGRVDARAVDRGALFVLRAAAFACVAR